MNPQTFEVREPSASGTGLKGLRLRGFRIGTDCGRLSAECLLPVVRSGCPPLGDTTTAGRTRVSLDRDPSGPLANENL